SRVNIRHKMNNSIADDMKGIETNQQRTLDERMIALDGTPNKSKLGANAILGVSMAAARASTKSSKIPLYQYLSTLTSDGTPKQYMLPAPMMNILNGGVHADGSLDFQEFMIVPAKAPNFREAL